MMQYEKRNSKFKCGALTSNNDHMLRSKISSKQPRTEAGGQE